MKKYFSLHNTLNQGPEAEKEEDSVSQEIINIIHNKKTNYPWPIFFTELKNSIFYYGIDHDNFSSDQTVITKQEKFKILSKQIKELEPRIEQLTITENDSKSFGEKFIFHFTLKNDPFKKIYNLHLKSIFNSNFLR